MTWSFVVLHALCVPVTGDTVNKTQTFFLEQFVSRRNVKREEERRRMRFEMRLIERFENENEETEETENTEEIFLNFFEML